jgi:hypothetical protein
MQVLPLDLRAFCLSHRFADLFGRRRDLNDVETFRRNVSTEFWRCLATSFKESDRIKFKRFLRKRLNLTQLNVQPVYLFISIHLLGRWASKALLGFGLGARNLFDHSGQELV